MQRRGHATNVRNRTVLVANAFFLPASFVSAASVAALLAFAVASASYAAERRWSAEQLWEQAVTRDLRFVADSGVLELDRGVLYEDDGPAAGFSYRPNQETLGPDLRVKKRLVVPRPQAAAAWLLVGPGGDLQASLDGRPLALEKLGKTNFYWDRYAFSPTALRTGDNDFELSGQGKIWIARADEFAAGSTSRGAPPDRSAKSLDGGKHWSFDRLGPRNDIDGEYYVRLFLDQHRAAGTATLPVVDVGNLTDEPIGARLASLDLPLRITVDSRRTSSGRVALRLRSAPVVNPDAPGWSDWTEVAAEPAPPGRPNDDSPLVHRFDGRLSGRFLQIELRLTTDDPLRSPQIREVRIQAPSELTKPADRAPPGETAAADDWRRQVRMTTERNARIVRSSIPFVYEPWDRPELRTLREKYRLDERVAGARDELELIARLAAWSSGLWEKGHLGEIYPAWNALEILAPHADGRPVGGFCQQYNLVFLQACESFGLVGRAVSIGPGDSGLKIRGGHEVVEIWSNQWSKWIYVDGNAAWYLVDARSRTPLSLRELRERQLAQHHGREAPAVELVTLAKTRETWTSLAAWPPFAELRMIPRSNFLEQRAPLPLNQGMRGWFWTGHHVWTDEASPASPLYGLRTRQPAAWDWTLNQTRIVLEATETAGTLRVHLDTQTPGFESFQVRQDDQAARSESSEFFWRLTPGTRRLEVRARNKAGREGPASVVELHYEP